MDFLCVCVGGGGGGGGGVVGSCAQVWGEGGPGWKEKGIMRKVTWGGGTEFASRYWDMYWEVGCITSCLL